MARARTEAPALLDRGEATGHPALLDRIDAEYGGDLVRLVVVRCSVRSCRTYNTVEVVVGDPAGVALPDLSKLWRDLGWRTRGGAPITAGAALCPTHRDTARC